MDLFTPRCPKLFQDHAKHLTYLNKPSLARYFELWSSVLPICCQPVIVNSMKSSVLNSSLPTESWKQATWCLWQHWHQLVHGWVVACRQTHRSLAHADTRQLYSVGSSDDLHYSHIHSHNKTSNRSRVLNKSRVSNTSQVFNWSRVSPYDVLMLLKTSILIKCYW